MINRIISFVLSMRLMAFLFIILAVSVTTATFIENDFESIAAKAVVYNSTWFEVLLGLILISLIGNIFYNKLYKKQKRFIKSMTKLL